MNGTNIGLHEGAFAPFEFEVSQNAIRGKNSLLIKVNNDYPMPVHVGDDGKKLDDRLLKIRTLKNQPMLQLT